MMKSRKAKTRATKKCRNCRPILLISTIAIAANNLYPSQLLLVAAFVFAQGPHQQQMPPSPTTEVLLGRRYAARDSNHQLQSALVNKLKREGVIQHDEVFQVMQQIDRANYVADRSAYSYPYDDSPQSITCGQTISAPHMHGYALEYILRALERPREKDGGGGGGGASAVTSSNTGEQQQEEAFTKVLDVGCGSGYLTAALGRWVHPHDGTSESRILSKPGKVYGYVHWMRWLCARLDYKRANETLTPLNHKLVYPQDGYSSRVSGNDKNEYSKGGWRFVRIRDGDTKSWQWVGRLAQCCAFRCYSCRCCSG